MGTEPCAPFAVFSVNAGEDQIEVVHMRGRATQIVEFCQKISIRRCVSDDERSTSDKVPIGSSDSRRE